ncbi:hypothetical protein F4604DRAFT_1570585, partial [Suillus subluteus]
IIYGLGPYIADYPEQLLLSGVVQNWCPKCVPFSNIYELISPDILHQIIKGTFKGHLVDWVEDYLLLTHRASCTAKIMDNIN